MFYETRLAVEKLLENGEQKVVKEHYIMDAMLHAEAEKISYELYPNAGQIDVTSVCRSDISEIINEKEDGVPFFKATVTDILTDDNGAEKEAKNKILVCAEDIMAATTLVQEYMKQGYDMRLDGIKRVKIVDYIKG